MTDNLSIWNKLSKTDPKHTKPFSRSGGFKGTAVKPIYCTERMTEQFGPCGVGWGINEPSFQVVNADSEILVYCTVSIWHGSRDCLIFGVGGDKCVAARSSGPFNDDEAFKKAFTDAIGNAMKQLGMSADVHMGLFDDSKYVNDLRAEFSEEKRPAKEPTALEKEYQAEWDMIGSAATLGDLSLIRLRITPKGALLDQVFADDEQAAYRIRDFLKKRTEELSQAPNAKAA